jgi:hypothetical protein
MEISHIYIDTPLLLLLLLPLPNLHLLLVYILEIPPTYPRKAPVTTSPRPVIASPPVQREPAASQTIESSYKPAPVASSTTSRVSHFSKKFL